MAGPRTMGIPYIYEMLQQIFRSGCSGSGSNYYRSYNDPNPYWGTYSVYYDDDHDHDNKPPDMGRPLQPPNRPSQLPSRPRSRTTGRRR